MDLRMFPLDDLHSECEDELDRAVRQAYLDGVRTGRAEVLTALADSTRNLNRKYGSPE